MIVWMASSVYSNALEGDLPSISRVGAARRHLKEALSPGFRNCSDDSRFLQSKTASDSVQTRFLLQGPPQPDRNQLGGAGLQPTCNVTPTTGMRRRMLEHLENWVPPGTFNNPSQLEPAARGCILRARTRTG